MTLEKNAFINNRYRVIEILGQGGMGSVYRAMDENLGATVALKENLFTTDESTRQFRREAMILANLRHPNLPRVYDHFIIGDQQYLVMDFIDGEDLRQRMERIGMISEDDSLQIGASICDALAYLHSRTPPVLHRDLKPGNVKITPEGQIFLVDFGLAKVVQESGHPTTTGARAMTPGYSPPEQYGTARTDPRTDIYSLGATLYASLCGVIPEDGLARAMDNAQLTPLRKRNPRISRRVAAVVEKAMAIDPVDRFQDAQEFKLALLGSKSKTQQTAGSYTITPPPIPTMAEEPTEGRTQADAAPRRGTSPVVPAPAGEERPFVSPLKKQKEREHRRRVALFRFVIFLIALTMVLSAILVPGILPADLLNSIPFLAPTPTATPSITPTPTDPPSPTPTSTPAPPTATNTSTATPTLPILTALVPGPEQSLTPELSPSPTPANTPVGGGSGQVAYASIRSGVPQIHLLDIADQSDTRLTDMPGGACQPAWSPQGDRLVFVSPCSGIEEIYSGAGLYITDAAGGGVTPLATVPGGDFDPAWSPDGEAIAFTSLRTGQMELFVINLDDQSLLQLTQGASNVESRQPAWSADGSQIAYTVRRLGVYQVWLMQADGSNQQQIVRSSTSFSDYLPTWSTDGGLILFNQRCAKTVCTPYVMRISGTDRSDQQGDRLQFLAGPIEDVEYSPDGFWLVYEGEQAVENRDILYMTVTGANRIRLTTDEAADFDPTWRPAPR